MKMKFTPVLVAGAVLFGLGSTNAQTSLKAKLATHKAFAQAGVQKRLPNLISLPGTGKTYQPDGGTGWIHMANVTYTYDNLGRITDRTSVNATTSANEYKLTYVYDSQGNWTENGDYLTDSNYQWLKTNNSTKFTYTYNSANQPSEIIFEQWDDVTTSYRPRSKSVRSYSAGGFLEQETHFVQANNAWELNSRDTYIFSNPNNPPTEIIFEEYDNGSFVNSERYSDITWHGYDISLALFPVMKPTFYKSHDWNGMAWENYERGAVTYDPYGGSLEIVEYNNNGNWENASRFTIAYDNHHNFTGEKGEQWNGSAWELSREDKEALTYNANLDITERIYLRDWSGSGTLVTDHKEVYSNFQYVSAAPVMVAALPVTIYPNPAQNSLYIAGDISEAAVVTFTDLTGRTVLTQKLPSGAHEIGIGSLPSGTYILHVANSAGSKTVKFVKL